jgi:beta-galactosidase/beta-glucuronidase
MTVTVNVTVHSSGGGQSPVQVLVYNSGTSNSTVSYNGTSDVPFQFTVPSPKLWSPESPTLYNLTVKMDADEVSSYTGFRTISKGTVDGVVRPLLNGAFVFIFGTLDQGYWPDGLYTPPNREAMVYDLEVLKNLGFNMVRKHVSHAAKNF